MASVYAVQFSYTANSIAHIWSYVRVKCVVVLDDDVVLKKAA